VVDIRHGHGVITVEADTLGRFSAEEVPFGQISLRCRLGSDQAPIVTGWISLLAVRSQLSPRGTCMLPERRPGGCRGKKLGRGPGNDPGDRAPNLLPNPWGTYWRTGFLVMTVVRRR
jgi:hypothetical protein